MLRKISSVLNTVLLAVIALRIYAPTLPALPTIPGNMSNAISAAVIMPRALATEAPVLQAVEIDPMPAKIAPPMVRSSMGEHRAEREFEQAAPKAEAPQVDPLARRPDESAQDYFKRTGRITGGAGRWWIRPRDNGEAEACMKPAFGPMPHMKLEDIPMIPCEKVLHDAPAGCKIWNLLPQECVCWEWPCPTQGG